MEDIQLLGGRHPTPDGPGDAGTAPQQPNGCERLVDAVFFVESRFLYKYIN